MYAHDGTSQGQKKFLHEKRVYIVEDNVFNRLVFQAALEMSGAYVEYDRHGLETIEHLKNRKPFDVVILDLMLPYGKSGFHLFNDIRTLEHYRTTPIVAVSAAEASIAIPRARLLGFAGFIPKPINEEVFAVQIASILDGQSLWIEDNRPSIE